MIQPAHRFRRIAGILAIAVMVLAGFTATHARAHAAVAAKVAPCHESAAKTAADACKERCAAGMPDQAVMTAVPVARAPALEQPIAHEVPRLMLAPLRTFVAAGAWWHPPPRQGLPVFLRHQRLLI